MVASNKVTRVTAKRIGDKLRVNWRKVDLEQLRTGIEHEQEHTDDLDTAARIALDHLYETPDYYARLEKAGLEVSAIETYEKAWRRIARELETLGWTILSFAPRRPVDAQLGDLPTRVEVPESFTGDLVGIVVRRSRRWRNLTGSSTTRGPVRFDMRLFLDVVPRGRRKVGLRPVDFDYRGMSARDFVSEIMQVAARKRGQKNLEQCLIHADCLQSPELAKACWAERHAEREEIEPPPDTQRSILREAADFVIKRCSCGKAYTHAEWERLPYVGIQSSGDEETELELRNCPCENTIAIERPKRQAKENPVHDDGAALVCMGRQVEIVLRDGREVKPNARIGMLYDELGEFWSPDSLLVASFDQGTEETTHGRGYFGKQAIVYEGHVDLPPESLGVWKKLGEVKEIYYDRAGTKHPGFFHHEFNKPRGLYRLLFLFKKAGKLPAVLYQYGDAFRIELPRGSIVDDRGIVMP